MTFDTTNLSSGFYLLVIARKPECEICVQRARYGQRKSPVSSKKRNILVLTPPFQNLFHVGACTHVENWALLGLQGQRLNQ
jgi:hypothetical protein